MLRSTLVALLFCFLVINAQNCDQPGLNHCSYKLGDFIGLNNTLSQQFFTDYTILFNSFLYKFGVNPGTSADLLNFCNGLEQFNACVANNKGCFTIKSLSTRTDLQSAYLCSGNTIMFTFNCGPGISTLMYEDLKCFQRILGNNQPYFQKCTASYANNVKFDSKNACNYINTLISCWSSPFKVAPCLPTDKSYLWWACETNKQFTVNQFASCNIDCNDKGRAALLSTAMEKHYKMENGEHWAKIPDYMDKVDGVVQKVEGEWMQLNF